MIVALPGLFSYLFYIVLFCSCVFSPFSFAITSLGEERANLSAFRTFVRFALVWFCLFPLPLGVWERLRFVIVALPGLFSLTFLSIIASPRFTCIWSTMKDSQEMRQIYKEHQFISKMLAPFQQYLLYRLKRYLSMHMKYYHETKDMPVLTI